MELKLGTVTCRGKTRAFPFGANARLHWAARNAWNAAWKDEVIMACKAAGIRKPAYGHVVVTVRSIQPPDRDNLFSMVKPVVDGLKGLAIVDDSPEHIVLDVCHERVGKRKDEGITIDLT